MHFSQHSSLIWKISYTGLLPVEIFKNEICQIQQGFTVILRISFSNLQFFKKDFVCNITKSQYLIFFFFFYMENNSITIRHIRERWGGGGQCKKNSSTLAGRLSDCVWTSYIELCMQNITFSNSACRNYEGCCMEVLTVCIIKLVNRTLKLLMV